MSNQIQIEISDHHGQGQPPEIERPTNDPNQLNISPDQAHQNENSNPNRHSLPALLRSLSKSNRAKNSEQVTTNATIDPEPTSNNSNNNAQNDPIQTSSFPGRPAGLHPLAIPPLSIKQKLYIILPQMIGAAIIDGLANFGIGCAMYLNATNVRIWILKNNTVAGDMAVTIFIQGVATFCIASGMVHVDLRKNKIKAFPYPWPDTSWGAFEKKAPEQSSSRLVKIWRNFNNNQGFTRGLHFFSGSDVNDIFDSRLTWRQFFRRLAWSIWKGSVLSVIYFFLIWPISIAIVSPIWAGENLGNGNFTAPLIKGVYGAVYGLLMNPICAMIAMGSEDSVRHHRSEIQKKRFEQIEKQPIMKTTAAERVSMIRSPGSGMNFNNSSHGINLDGRGHDGLIMNPQNNNSQSNHNLRASEGGEGTKRVQSLRKSLELSNSSLINHNRIGSSSNLGNERRDRNGAIAGGLSPMHRRKSSTGYYYNNTNTNRRSLEGSASYQLSRAASSPHQRYRNNLSLDEEPPNLTSTNTNEEPSSSTAPNDTNRNEDGQPKSNNHGNDVERGSNLRSKTGGGVDLIDE